MLTATKNRPPDFGPMLLVMNQYRYVLLDGHGIVDKNVDRFDACGQL